MLTTAELETQAIAEQFLQNILATLENGNFPFRQIAMITDCAISQHPCDVTIPLGIGQTFTISRKQARTVMAMIQSDAELFDVVSLFFDNRQLFERI